MIHFKLVIAEHGTVIANAYLHQAEARLAQLLEQAKAYEQWYIVSSRDAITWSYAAGDYSFYELEFLDIDYEPKFTIPQYNTENMPRE